MPPTVHEGWIVGKRAQAAKPYTFTMALQSGDLDGLASKMDEIAAGSGEWLSDEELGQYAAPSSNTSDAALAFLTAAGISPSQITMSKHGDYVTVDTTVEQVENLFDTQLYDHVFESQHLAIRAPSGFALPQGLDEHIVDVSPLAHFGAPHATQSASALGPLDPADVEEALEQQKREVDEMAQHFETRQSNSGNPSSCSGYKSFMSPACLRDLYQTSSAKAVAVAGQVDLGVVGIINASFNQDDLTAFAQRFRKDAVDYALISLRIAIERAPLKAFQRLSLLDVHPNALLFLNPSMGPGARPDPPLGRTCPTAAAQSIWGATPPSTLSAAPVVADAASEPT